MAVVAGVVADAAEIAATAETAGIAGSKIHLAAVRRSAV
jgi:hypothetical protein